MVYAYEHFGSEQLARDAHFTSGPRPGEQLPGFELADTAGQVHRKGDHLGRPVLLATGSWT